MKLCLAALALSDHDSFEVIVVDDGSTEPVEPVVACHGFRHLRINGPGGPARARNRGVEIAAGRLVVFIDADVCVREDTLARFAGAFDSDPELAAVLGSYDDAPAEPNFLSQYKNLLHHYTHKSSDGEISTFWSGCGAIRRDLFLAFGGFDQRRYRRPSIEDIELGMWMKAAGHRIVLDSRIEVKHLKRWTFLSLLKSDIFDRAIPWTRLMLRAGGRANTLNVKPSQQISVALFYLMAASLLTAVWWPMLLAIAAMMAALIVFLNLDFYRFLTSRKSLRFTLCIVPLHWLYFGYCGISAVLGALLYCTADRADRLC